MVYQHQNNRKMKTVEYQKLIDEFAKLPKQERQDETLISIIRGKAHDEKVSSNILAFFLDTTREHDFGNLFVKSLVISKFQQVIF